MSRLMLRPRLGDLLNRQLSHHSLRVASFLSLILGLGIGFLLMLNQFKQHQSVLAALREDITLLSASSDSKEIERVLGSFSGAMPGSRFLYVKDGVIEVSIPDMQLAETAFRAPNLTSFAGMRFFGLEMYSQIPLLDDSSHMQYGDLILISPAGPAILSAIVTAILSFLLGGILLLYTRRLTKLVLEETLRPLAVLHADLNRVGQGIAPIARPEEFEVAELGDISELVNRQHRDVRKMTELHAHAEGEKRAKEAVRSLLHDLLNPYTALSNLIQSRIEFPEDSEIRDELKSQWSELDSQIRSLIKTARHLEIERLRPVKTDLSTTVRSGAEMGAVKNPTSLKIVDQENGVTALTVPHDPELIARAVANLVRNSIEEGADQVEVWCDPKPLCVHVRDNGPGIPAEKVAPLFEGRLKSSKADGSGIGFPTALRLVELHGGKIYLSKGGAGAHFKIDLSCLEGSTV